MLKERLKALLPKGAFGRSVTILAGGTAVGQAIAILASPVLTRLYGPADFGVLAVYTAVIGIAGGLAALSYHQAIPLPEGDAEAANVLGVSIVSTILVAALTAVAVAIGGSRLAALLGSPGLVPYLWMIPLGVLGLASYEVLTQWAVRKKAFPTIARTSVAKGVAQTGTQLGLGFAGLGPFGLLLGQLVGQWTGSGSLLRKALAESGRAIRGVTASGLRAAASRYRRFPQFTAPAVLLNVAGMEAPPLILSALFGGTVTGLYALGARVIMMPIALVAKSAAQVFFASAPQHRRDGTLGREVERLFGRMLRLAAAPVLILGIAAPALFAIVFGEEWREAGVYVRWLSPLLLFVFVAFALAPLVSVLERQRAGMIFQAILTTVRIGALVAGGVLGTPLLAIALFGAASAACWAVYLAWLLVAGGASPGASAWLFLRNLLAALPFAAPVAVCLIFDTPDWTAAAAAAAGGLGAVAWMMRGRGGAREVA